ncbi:MAG: hypothetical protein A2026_21360 [Deltaproteobacteria bacterium RBG_19FT_COMBO_46_12]|nr:MAG: hypothetical protein A2026_21360 [Deltaproteobacteria bacterium RBG_19FT_COMBO_46_12]
MRKIFFVLLGLLLTAWVTACAPKKDLEVEGKKLVSLKPPFTLMLPSDFNLIHSFSHENPEENSLTRVYFLIKTKEKQVEEMFILQVADKTNPQAGPMTMPPLKPYTEKRLYSKGKVKKGELEGEYLIQSMAWNPEAPSLQPIVKKGFVIPSRWALQGQFLFPYQGEHAVFFRYSRDVHSFGMKVSGKGEDWEKGLISGNEKRVHETFQKSYMEMINSIQIKNP